MVRVLHSVSYMHRAGVETFLMNYYRHIDRDVIQFDFLCNKELPGDYDDEIRALGGRIFYRPGFDLLREENYVEFWNNFLAEHPEIQIVHAHNGAKQYYPLQGAQKAGIPIRIAHAHSSDFVHDEKYQYRRSLINLLPHSASYYFGCSNAAGKFFFGDELWKKEGILIRNAVPCQKFTWDPMRRQNLRDQMNLAGCFVVGHVGRFMTQKNHSRLVDIFKTVYDINRNARLLLIGDGEQLDVIKSKVKKLSLENAVIFAGNQADMTQWYQIMDVFVMPSFFEGLPVSGVEAQAAGLPCIFSDVVSQEAAITKNVRYASLHLSNSEWADIILAYSNFKRVDTQKEIRSAGYDIVVEATRLKEIYLSFIKKNIGDENDSCS